MLRRYNQVYDIDSDILEYLSSILQELFTQDTLTNDEEEVVFIKNSFLSQFQPKFKDLIQDCGQMISVLLTKYCRMKMSYTEF